MRLAHVEVFARSIFNVLKGTPVQSLILILQQKNFSPFKITLHLSTISSIEETGVKSFTRVSSNVTQK